MKRASLVCALVSILLGASIGAKAQTATGQITGTLTDATGAVVPGAKVTVASEQTGLTRDAVSNGSGDYSFTWPWNSVGL